MMQYDVIVVGSGLVGSIQGLLLAEAGFTVLLLDSQPKAQLKYLGDQDLNNLPPSLRMSLLTLRSTEILAQFGIDKGLDKRSGLVDKMHIWDANGPGEMNFDSLSIGKNCLGKLVENDFLQELLDQKIYLHQNIKVIRSCKISSIVKLVNHTEINLFLSNQEAGIYTCNLLIGADGANSWLRDYFNFACDTEPYNHSALVTNVYTKQVTDSTAYQLFLPTGPIAFLPWMNWQDKHTFSIVWSQPEQDAEHWQDCDKQLFIDKLNALTANKFNLIDCDTRVSFPLIKRHVGQYYNNGCVLIGDAAHTIHPLAGQGLNLGIYDAEVLAQTLIFARDKKYKLDSEFVLKKYDLARRGHNQLILNLMSFFKNIYSSDHTSVKLFRNLGMNLIDNVGLLKKKIARQAAGYF